MTMKNAELWKRIVKYGFLDPAEISVRPLTIVRAPIIVDASLSDIDEKVEVVNGTPVCMPFSECWIEGKEKSGDINWGVYASQNDPDAGVAMWTYWNFPRSGGAVYFGTVWVMSVKAGVAANVSPPGDGKGDARRLFSRFAITCAVGVLEMLSCSNVQPEPRRQPDAGIVREATRRNGGHAAGFRYHVLTVRPAGSKPGTKGEEIGNMPRHVCRGHFAEYGERYGKGKLFGRYEGRFYIPPHMKGDKKNGVVEKDYEVAASSKGRQ